MIVRDPFLDRIREESNVADLLTEEGVELKRRGRHMAALCTLHQENTPSLIVFASGGWRCFGCGQGGDVFAYVMKRHACTFAESVAVLARWLGLDRTEYRRGVLPPSPRPSPRPSARTSGEPDFTRFAEARAAMATEAELLPHAVSMGLPGTGPLRQLGCFVARRSSRRYAIFPDAHGQFPLLAPMRCSIVGPVCGFRTRSLAPLPGRDRYACAKSSQNALFIPERVPTAGTVWLPEGLSDACALLALGLVVIGRPSADMRNAAVLSLARLAHARDVVLLGDNDEKPDGSWPGRASVDRLASALVGRVCRLHVMFPPAGCKDMRDWIAAGATREDIEARLATHAVEHVPVITGARR